LNQDDEDADPCDIASEIAALYNFSFQ